MFLSKKNSPKIILIIALSSLLTACAFMAYMQEVYSEEVNVTGCYSTTPQNPDNTIYFSIREENHEFIIYTSDVPANILASGKYETVYKNGKDVICRVNTENGTVYVSIHNKSAVILGLDGKEYKLQKKSDTFTLINIEEKDGKYSPRVEF